SQKVALLASSANSYLSASARWSYRTSRKFLIRASCSAKVKLSGLAVPSCCCGSSQRAAMLVCQASVIFPLDATFGWARRPRTNGAASEVVASAAERRIVRRVRGRWFITSSLSIHKGVTQNLSYYSRLPKDPPTGARGAPCSDELDVRRT